MKQAIAIAADAVVLPRIHYLRALGELLRLTLRQHVHGRRLLVLSLLFALPSALAAAVVWASHLTPPAAGLEFALLLNLIPNALAPLVALVFAVGIVQDEVEDQTLTYLLLRPLPRWALYLVKLLATLLVTSLLTAVFTIATRTVIALLAQESLSVELAGRALQTAGLLALAQVAYCGLFGLLGLLTRRSLVVGVGYIVLLEGLLASFDTVARRLTAMYYFRVLALRCLQPAGNRDWSIDLAAAPTTTTCVLTLLGAGMVLAIMAAFYFAQSEFRMKTPAGN